MYADSNFEMASSMISGTEISIIRKKIARISLYLPAVFRALSDQRRFQIVQVFMREPELCVTEIADIFNITLAAASQQLRILADAGLLQKTRKGKIVCYRLKKENTLVKQIVRVI